MAGREPKGRNLKVKQRRPTRRKSQKEYSPPDLTAGFSKAFEATKGFEDFKAKLPDTERDALRAGREKEALYHMRESFLLGLLSKKPKKWGSNEQLLYSGLPEGQELTLKRIDEEIAERDRTITNHLRRIGKLPNENH